MARRRAEEVGGIGVEQPGVICAIDDSRDGANLGFRQPAEVMHHLRRFAFAAPRHCALLRQDRDGSRPAAEEQLVVTWSAGRAEILELDDDPSVGLYRALEGAGLDMVDRLLDSGPGSRCGGWVVEQGTSRGAMS